MRGTLRDPRIVTRRWTSPARRRSSDGVARRRRQPFDIAAGPLGDVLAALSSASPASRRARHRRHRWTDPVARRVWRCSRRSRRSSSCWWAPARRLRVHLPGDVVPRHPGVRVESVEVTGRLPAVSSPKYTAPLRDIAADDRGHPARGRSSSRASTTLSEALRNVPGITLQAGEGGGASSTAGDMFNMRGFNAINSLFVDGVRDDGLIARDVFNLEQVEVFLGPTGSDVGRGTAAGYVNMQTKSAAPRTRHVGAARLRHRRSAARCTADVNQAAAARRSRAAGWRETRVPPERAVAGQRRAGPRRRRAANSRRSRRRWRSASARRPASSPSAQIMRQDNLPDYGIPGAAWQDEPLAPTTVQRAAPVDQSNFYGSLGYDYDKASQDSYTARVEHDVNRRLTLRNQTRYNKTHREAVITAIQNVAAYNAGDEPGHPRAAGQRAREQRSSRTRRA